MKRITTALFLMFALVMWNCSNNSGETEERQDATEHAHEAGEHEHKEEGMHEHDGEGKHSHDNSDQDYESVESNNASIPEDSQKALLNGYYNLKDALVATDAKEAKVQAEKLSTLTANHAALDAVDKALKNIINSEEVAVQRSAFKIVSEQVYALVKANPMEGQKVYKQFCPMAFKNTGAYWLSKEEKILNPYFGDKMLHCGSVQEEI